jgi:hypothetical protein
MWASTSSDQGVKSLVDLFRPQSSEDLLKISPALLICVVCNILNSSGSGSFYMFSYLNKKLWEEIIRILSLHKSLKMFNRLQVIVFSSFNIYCHIG